MFQPNTEIFRVGDRVVDEMNRKGTIKAMRDDSHEKTSRQNNPNHGYYYWVEYDNGKFDTYVSGFWMKRT